MSRRQKRLQQRRHARPKQRKRHPVKAIGSGVAVLAVAAMAGLLGWDWWANHAPGPTLPAPPSWLRKCPVGGGPVNFAHRVSTSDGPLFLCCEHCLERFNADPSMFIAPADAQREILKSLPRVQVTCAVSGDLIDPTIHVESPSGSVYFCSPNCRDLYVETPDQYRGGLADSLWYQTTCPVDDIPINPAVSTTLPAGETVYSCSEECRDEVTRDLATYAVQLARQGVRLHLD